MVGSGVGAKKGVLFKTASALEATGKTDFVVLDKTGTVTQGKPQVTDLHPAPGVAEAELLQTAAAQHMRCFRGKIHQALNGVGRFALAVGFQQLANGDER